MDRQQAELEAGIRDATALANWKEADRARFMQTVPRSQPNTDFDREIAWLTAELRGMLQALQRGEVKGAHANDRYVVRIRELTGQPGSVHARQSAYLAQQLRNVQPVPRP